MNMQQQQQQQHHNQFSTQKMSFILSNKTIASINVDCIKVCPFDTNLFALAYYQQLPGEKFLGGVSLQYNKKNKKTINQLQGQQQVNKTKFDQNIFDTFNILPCGPVLHICWLNHPIEQNKYILVGASRSEKIFIFTIYKSLQLQDKQNLCGKYKIQLSKEIFIEKNVFCLYVDCFMERKESQMFMVIVSTNQSEVYQLQISSKGNNNQNNNQNNYNNENNNENNSNIYQIIDKKVYCKHEYAVWTCRLNNFNNQMNSKIFACGDQVNKIYLYSTTQRNPINKNSSSHSQGICDLTFSSQYRLYSGGFDGVLNQFDLRMFNKQVMKINLGGTVWRVIEDKQKEKLLVCNSSEKKFQVIGINGINNNKGQQKQNKWKNENKGNQFVELWNSGIEHTSLAYAADWDHQNNVLVTASFYDKIVCKWDNWNY